MDSSEFNRVIDAEMARLTPAPEVLPQRRTLRGRIRQAGAALKRAVRS